MEVKKEEEEVSVATKWPFDDFVTMKRSKFTLADKSQREVLATPLRLNDKPQVCCVLDSTPKVKEEKPKRQRKTAADTKLSSKARVTRKPRNQPAPRLIPTVKKEIYVRCENLNDTLDREILEQLKLKHPPKPKPPKKAPKRPTKPTRKGLNSSDAENIDPSVPFSGITFRKRKLSDPPTQNKFFKSRAH